MLIHNRRSLALALALAASSTLFAQNDSLVQKHPAHAMTGGKPLLPAQMANSNLKGNGIKRFLVGKNYRREWIEPVDAPVLNLRTEKGGLTPKKEGGGKETRSLQVEDASGKGWSLRSIRKYPEKAVPEMLQNTVAEEIVADDISASYPFGVLSMGVLSDAANVPYLRNKLFYLPNDEALGQYREKYGNALVLMEEREPDYFFDRHQKGHPKLKSIDTEELIYELAESSRNRVDQLSVLRARLLDNFVMDFDRHEGQWNWVGFDSAGFKTYYPIPKDRDQVFYTNQGLLPKFMRSKGRLPELQGFKAKVEHPNTFNRTARNFDRTFLTQLTREDWEREIDHFIAAMTDGVIDEAMAQQPEEIRKYDALKIAATLKKKRRYFKKDMMRYYRELASEVAIVATNEGDAFTIAKQADEGVLVTLRSADSSIAYQRLFNPKDTKELDLYGLEGDDRFLAMGPKSAIKVRMIGGPGRDRFENEGNGGKMIAYDVRFENNTTDKAFSNRIKNDPLNNTYTRLGYAYKISGIGPAVELTPAQGLFLGLSYKILTPGFRIQPYKMRQVFSVTHSLSSIGFHFRYDADFIQAFGRTDLLIRSDYLMPSTRTNFFGYGNKTSIDSRLFEHDYYHARYDVANISVMGRSHITHSFLVSYGPVFQHINLREEENRGKFVASYITPFSNQAYRKKYYAGGEVRLALDTRNDPALPTRGVLLTAYARTLRGLNAASHNVNQTGGSFSAYADFGSHGRFVFATLFGGGRNDGRFELPQAQYLGFTDHLRGYRLQRFAGRSSAYNNTELRLRLADVNAWLFHTTVGVYGFHDIGRVWADGEKSDTWHRGWGGGVWVAPFNKIVFTGYLSFSSEEKALPWATIGFVF